MAVLDREVVLDAELQRLAAPQAEGRADGLAIVAPQPSFFVPDPTSRVVYPERRVENAVLGTAELSVIKVALARWVWKDADFLPKIYLRARLDRQRRSEEGAVYLNKALADVPSGEVAVLPDWNVAHLPPQ